MGVKCNLKLIMLTEYNDISQKEMAKKLGIGQSHFSRIVNSKICPSLEMALKISKKLNKTVNEIWELTPE